MTGLNTTLHVIGDRIEYNGQVVGRVVCTEGTVRQAFIQHLLSDYNMGYAKGLRVGYDAGHADGEAGEEVVVG